MYHLNILLTNKKDFIIYSLARPLLPFFSGCLTNKTYYCCGLTHTYIHIFFNLRMCML